MHPASVCANKFIDVTREACRKRIAFLQLIRDATETLVDLLAEINVFYALFLFSLSSSFLNRVFYNFYYQINFRFRFEICIRFVITFFFILRSQNFLKDLLDR